MNREIDIDDEKHILIDKWIYLSFDNSMILLSIFI